jgi:hypothetical protein
MDNDAALNLHFYQLDFFAQDNWRILPNLSLALGLRYEYNTPAAENRRRLESSFNDPALPLAPGLNTFIDGRTRVFDRDTNNFAPRFSLAYAPDAKRSLVLRAGVAVFYDQILGAVASLSRSSFPRFLNVNTAGGQGNLFFGQGVGLSILNPALNPTFVQIGQLNRLPPGGLVGAINQLNLIASGGNLLPPASGVEITLPRRALTMPYAYQTTAGVEKQITNDLALAATFVGTRGEDLIRFATPNLGSNAISLPFLFSAPLSGEARFTPNFIGFAVQPGSRIAGGVISGGRPVPNVGGVSIFETEGRSFYRSLQLQARGRLARALRFQAAYTLSETVDDVSDVFELAGAPALPQNSFTRAGERAPSNFDARHRFSYYFIYDVPSPESSAFLRALFKDFHVAGTGQFQTGSPFTVNSLFDINLDGNLTDRPDSTNGLVVTGDRSRPVRLTVDPRLLVAFPGQDGGVARNSFRAGNFLDLNLAFSKGVSFTERQRLLLRMEIFNFINRANFGAPVRFLEAVGFGQATETLTPARRIQFGLKYQF